MTATLTSTTTIIENFNGWKGEQLVKQCGAAYVPGRDVKDIAADVRSIIKKAIKSGYLPKSLKVSVKIERYSMGCSLNVAVTACDEIMINMESWLKMREWKWMGSWADAGSRYSVKGHEVLDFLKQVVKAFQKSEYHGGSDYSNTNFHSDVSIDIEDEQFEKIIAEYPNHIVA